MGLTGSHSISHVQRYIVAKKVDELQEILKKKDEDMRRMEERYKRYVDKARTHDSEKSRSRHDQEEKLIISAWYNMVRIFQISHNSS
ncbi:protein Hook [Pimephales promelas]|nr:protein Hook [Pimephales promelas]